MTFRSLLIALGVLSIGGASSFAQTTWNGLGFPNQNWSDNLNWSPAVVPVNNGTAAIVFSNAVPYTSIVDTTYSISTLTIQATAASVTLNSSGGSTLTVTNFTDTGLFGVNVGVAIVGASTVTQNGLSTLTFTAAGSTYTGNTVVSSGSLTDSVANAFSPNSLLEVANPGIITVNNNETALGLNDTGGGNGTVSLASLGTVLILNGGVSTNFSGIISGPGGLEKNGTSTMTLTGANTYTGATLVDTGSDIEIGNGGLTGSIVSNVSSTGTGALSFDRSNAYTYAGTLSGSLNVVQVGSGTTKLTGTNTYSGPTTLLGGTLQAGSTSAFGGATGLSAVTVNAGATLDLNGNSNTVGTIFGAGTVALGSATLTAGNTIGSTFFSGSLTGTGGLVSGEFALTLSGTTNTYSGGTTITGGSLVANNASGSATGSGAITINSGGALVIGQANLLGSINATAPITDNGSLNFFRTDVTANVIANSITGTGGVFQAGTGITELTGINSYSGTTTVQSGTLQAGNNFAFGNTGLSAVNMTGSGILDLNGFSNTVGSINGTFGGSSITIGGAVLTIGDPTSNTTYYGTISGVGGSLSFGGNTMILQNASTYTGGTLITHGTIQVANPSGSATGPGTITISPGAILSIGAGSTAGSVAATTIGDNGMIDFNRSDIPTYSVAISGTGGTTLNGGGIILTGNNTYSGGTTINAGVFTIGDGVTAGARITGNVFDAASLAFAPASGDNYTFAGLISGTGVVTFSGPGSITLSGANTYSGLTSVNGGNLADAAANSFSANSQMLVNSSGGSLSVNFDETVGDLENGGSGGPVSIASGKVLTSLGAVYGGDFLGTISGNGGFSVAAGIQGLAGNNTYTGGTLITGTGELFIGSNNAIGTGTLTFAGSAPEMSPDANVTLANAIVLNAVFDNDDGLTNNLTLTGPITGPSGITWCAPGMLTLTNPGNTFSGTLDMRDGYLLVGNTGATGTGTIVLDSATTMNVVTGVTVSNPISFTGTAATLTGSGTITAPVTVNNGVVLSPNASPGNGPGNLTFTSGMTLASGGAIHLDLFDATGVAGTGYSLITVNAGLTVAAMPGSITFNLVSTDSAGNAANAVNFNPASSYAWTFATSTGLTGFVGNEFNLVTSGFTNATGGGSFSITGTATDLILNFTPVPEPTTWAMLGAGVLALVPFGLRRRRWAKA